VDDFRTIGEVLRRRADKHPEKIAFKIGDRKRTFGALFERVQHLVGGLTEAGLKEGDRVAILSKNSIEFVEGYGVSLAGLIPVPLNWRLAASELATVLEDCSPAVLLYQDVFSDVVERIRSNLHFGIEIFEFASNGSPSSSYERLIAGANLPASYPRISECDTACLLYTSGTTGRPKGAELTHRGLLRNARATIDQLLGLQEDDIALAAMPFFHVGGMWYHLFPSFAAGCTSIILSEFEPRIVLKAIEQEQITNVHLVPTMIHALLACPGRDAIDLSSLRIIFYAASTIPSELLRSATAAFTCDFVQGYGSTEGGMISCLSAEDHRKAEHDEALLFSCGRPLRDVEVRLEQIVFDEGQEIGEIFAKSEMTMARYWRNPVATAEAMRSDWLRTGDLARRDQEGFLYIVDRRSDMIVSGGENVYPREVEEILFAHPAVVDAAVFGIPDEKWVQRVVAVVVLKPGSSVTPASLLADVKSRLASYKCPKEIFISNELPKNGAGKVLRRVLRDKYSTTRSV
jgi:acyl-CoA synthetase (AMP-forming)/AMP-acid ligase II